MTPRLLQKRKILRFFLKRDWGLLGVSLAGVRLKTQDQKIQTKDFYVVKIKNSKRQEGAKLLRRLYGIMTSQLDMIEARHKKSHHIGQELMTSAESEKEARTLGSLTKQLENMIALEDALKNQGCEEGADDGTNTEQLRQNLTQRLTKFEGLPSRGT